MNTPLIGYLIMLANLQSNGPLKNTAVRVADIGTLTNEIKVDHPQFPPAAFKATGFYRVGNVAIYASTNVVNYMVYGTGDPGDQGVLVIFYYDHVPGNPTSTGLDDGTMEFVDKEPPEIKKYLDLVRHSST